MHDASIASLLDALRAEPALHALQRDLAATEPGGRSGPQGLPDAAQPALLAALLEGSRAPVVWLVPQPDEARALLESLRAYLPDPERLHLFPAPDPLPYERIAWDPATREARLATLGALLAARRARGAGREAGPGPFVITTARGLLTPTLAPDLLDEHAIGLSVGQTLGLTEAARHLERLGYETVPRVNSPGEMARRGGILDVYPPERAEPLRAEWFGDEIESLRSFDPTSQRSSKDLRSAAIGPASEVLATRGAAAAARIQALELHGLHPLAQSELRRHAERLAEGQRFPGIEFYAPLLQPERSTLLDHLPTDAWLVIDDEGRWSSACEAVVEQAETVRREQVDAGELPAAWTERPLQAWSTLAPAAESRRRLFIGRVADRAVAAEGPAQAFGAPERYAGRVEEAVVDALAAAESGDAVLIVSRQAPRIADLLADAGRSVAVAESLAAAPGPGGLALVQGALGAGWTLARAAGHRLIVLSDGEIFGWRQPFRRRRARDAGAAARPDFFSELRPGDYVVHIEHGIGLFRGLERMALGDVERDYLHLEYAAGDTLYVPTHQADRVARYVGTGDIEPGVTRLGTADWERAKARARREIEDIAEELLGLYARRETVRRAAFAADTAWQADMEAAFPFVETEDQLRAIEDVKRDMESERPMDRLVVGDVGFGKTEVALRAAFKAVMGGRQVAVLAPTTVLAQQHYETFNRRLGAYPVRIEVLSRFRKRGEQKQVLERLAQGEVDIVIGTHRLLSGDVSFKELGLLVVDEEHRFGVKHKERLRQMAEGVDTLTLTATPIPRTMHLALTGLRDLTKIDTPPSERLPVVTHVGPWDENLVRQAVKREIDRRGQVFYVFHRVRGIEHIAQKILKLVPEARVAVAHGQMKEAELASAMLDFVGGAVDVLVCTSIIESGLDIPNANTLLVERADRFGLAQLHQLRGRVGRSSQRAYAYFLHPIGWEMSPEAQQRLGALAEDAELGAGFRIAMRDLEIRGAGEILGARQHGHVAAIGLDLYTRLLAEAIKKVSADREEVTAMPRELAKEIASIDPGTMPTVDLPLDAYLPDGYIEETAERTRLYRRMARVESLEAVREVERELRDRFGAPPAAVRHLLLVLRLRVLAHMAGAASVALEGSTAAVRWPSDRPVDRSALKPRLPDDAILGRYRVALPVRGPVERWIPALLRLLRTAAELERGVPVDDEAESPAAL